MSTISPITIRRDRPADASAVARVAALDSRRPPAGRLLLAEVDGELVAAAPLDGGAPVADPFRPTAAIVDLLQLRVAQERAAQAQDPGSRWSHSPRLPATPRASRA